MNYLLGLIFIIGLLFGLILIKIKLILFYKYKYRHVNFEVPFVSWEVVFLNREIENIKEKLQFLYKQLGDAIELEVTFILERYSTLIDEMESNLYRKVKLLEKLKNV